VVLTYTALDGPEPGEVLITVVGSQGIRLLGKVEGGGPLFEGLGRVHLLPVDGTPTKGPVRIPPFDPTPGAVNPTDEMVNRAAGIAVLLAALTFIHYLSSRPRQRPAERIEPQRPTIPLAPPLIPRTVTQSVPREPNQVREPAAGCQLALIPENRNYVGNGDDRIQFGIKATPFPGWQARILPGSVRFQSSYPRDYQTFLPVEGSSGADRLTCQAQIPWEWKDTEVTVTLGQVAIELTPEPGLAAQGAKPKLWQLQKPISQSLRVLGAEPRVIVEAVPGVIDATGWDHTRIEIKEFWLFRQPVSVKEESFKVKARGWFGGRLWEDTENPGSWTPPFLVQEKGYVESVRLEVGCTWTAGRWWQRAMEARRKDPGRNGEPRFLDAENGFALGSLRRQDGSAFEPCEVFLRGCTAERTTVTGLFLPLPDMPLYATARLLTADGTRGVRNPFQNRSSGKDKAVCSERASVLCEVVDLSQGQPDRTKGYKLPPRLALDLPRQEHGSGRPAEEQVRALLKEAPRERRSRLEVAVDEKGSLYTTAVRPGPFSLVRESEGGEESTIQVVEGKQGDITLREQSPGKAEVTVQPREPILFLGRYRVHPGFEPVHDGPVVYTLVIDDGLGGKVELVGACRVSLGSLVLETGGPDFRIYEHQPYSLELKYRPGPGYRPKLTGAEKAQLTWAFAVVDNEGTPLRSGGEQTTGKFRLIIGRTPRGRVIYVNPETGEVLRLLPDLDRPGGQGPPWRRVEDEDRGHSADLRGQWHKLRDRFQIEQGLPWLPIPGEGTGQPSPWKDTTLPLAVRVEMRDQNGNLLATSDRFTGSGGRTPPEFVWRDHRFRYVLLMLRLLLQDSTGQPYRDQNYHWQAAGQASRARTGPQGLVEQLIPVDAEEGTLTVLHGEGATEKVGCVFTLKLGYLDPAGEVRGAQARLNNLGLFASPQVTGKADEQFRRAVQRFQSLWHLDATGELDEPTSQRLEAVHQMGLQPGESARGETGGRKA
jgi:hypothetical protein